MRRLLALLALWPGLAFGSAGDARPVPIRGEAYRLTFALFNTDTSALTGAAALDTECGLDATAPTDCTAEATEIGDGLYYIDLTAAEMTADTVTVAINTSSIPGPTIITINPVDVTGADWPSNSWDVDLSAHLTAGSTGLALNSAGAAGDFGSAVCSAYTTPGTYGYIACGKLPLIGTTNGLIVSPVGSGGTITIRRGVTYAPSLGSAYTISLTDTTGVHPSFSGGTATWTIYSGTTSILSVSATIASADLLTVSLTATQTAALTAGNYTYQYSVVLAAAAGTVKPATGTLVVQQP